MRKLFLAIALVGLFAANAQATLSVYSLSGLYNTGVDSSGTPLADGTADPHYVAYENSTGPALTETSLTSAGGFPVGPWLGDDTLSAWISTNGHGNQDAATFDNTTTFSSPITGLATIIGQWSTDNEAPAIYVDGVKVNNGNNNEFASWTPFTIYANVVAGSNTIDFQSHNDGGPGGVRVEIGSGTVTPEPASIAIWGLAISAGLMIARRRRG